MLINRKPTGFITSSRGLRRGYLLSPYLFLLCTESLLSLLSKAANEKKITGIQIYRRTLSINHLLFADDSVLFYKIDLVENQNILDLLHLYEEASGQ